MTRPPILFVRHGETDWNRQGRLQGRQDIPLNAFGRVQAEEIARRVAAAGIDLETLDWVASPLARTRETMEILRRTLALDPAGYRIEPGFIELAFGAWEGMTWREIRKADPGRAAERARDKWGYVPPDGESYAMLAERLAAPLAALTKPTVLVSHGGVARGLLHLLAAVPVTEAPQTDIWQGRLLVLRDGGAEWN